MSRPSQRFSGSRADPGVRQLAQRRARTRRAPRFAFIRGCSSSPATITSRRGPARRAAAMRRGRSSARSTTCATPSLRPGPFADVDDLNAQFRRWRDEIAHQRPHPEQRDRTVADVFAEEQPRLLPLPAHPFETDVMRTVVSGKTPVRALRSQSATRFPTRTCAAR